MLSRSKRASSASAPSGVVGLGQRALPPRPRTRPSRGGRSRRAPSIVPTCRCPPTYHDARAASPLSRDRQPGAGQLGEGVGLVPVHPGPAVLDRHPVPVGAPGPPAEAVAGLQQQHVAPAQRALTGGGDAGKSAPDDDHVVISSTLRRVDGDRAARRPTSTGLQLDEARTRLEQQLAPTPTASAHDGLHVDGRRARGRRAAAARPAATAAPARCGRRRRAAARRRRPRSSSVQTPPSPSTSAGTTPSVVGGHDQLHAGGRHRLGEHDAAVLARRGPPAGHMRSRTSAAEPSPSATAPSSDLCCTVAALSFRTMRRSAAELRQRADRIVAVGHHPPVGHRHAGRAQQLLGGRARAASRGRRARVARARGGDQAQPPGVAAPGARMARRTQIPVRNPATAATPAAAISTRRRRRAARGASSRRSSGPG